MISRLRTRCVPLLGLVLAILGPGHLFAQLSGPDPGDLAIGSIALQNADASSALGGSAIPPAGVDVLLQWYGGAGAGEICVIRLPAGLVTTHLGAPDSSGCALAPLDSIYVIPAISSGPRGFELRRAVDVTVTAADGTVVYARTALPTGVGLWTVPLGLPVASYTISVQQDDLQTGGDFSVRLREDPRHVEAPASGPPGATFYAFMAGFTPGVSVPVYLYRYTGAGKSSYVGMAAIASIDDQGEAVLAIPTRADDPLGYYTVKAGAEAQDPNHDAAFVSFQLIRSGHPGRWPTPADADIAAFARSVIDNANSVWAAVESNSAPVSALACVYSGSLLNQVSRDIAEIRALGQKVVVSQTEPLTLVQAKGEPSDSMWDIAPTSAEVVEHWQITVLNADGAEVDNRVLDVPHHYMFSPPAASSTCKPRVPLLDESATS